MNRIFLSRLAACRIRSSALGASVRRCVRDAFCWRGFPLVSPLPSTASSAGRPASFGGFVGTTRRSDFPEPFIIGVRLCGFPTRPAAPSAAGNSGISRFPCMVFPSVHRVSDRAGAGASRDGDAPGVAFRFSLQRRRPGEKDFRG